MYIIDIYKITERHGSIESALNDFQGKHAIFMCISQIGEKLNKIKSSALRSRLPVKEAYSFRNIAVHDYEGVDIETTIQTVSKSIPELEKLIQKIVKEL